MKKQTIEISCDNILQHIYTHTYYIGEARKVSGIAPHLAAALQASDSNKDILIRHIKSSIAEATKILTRFLGICNAVYSNDDSSITLCIETPLNYPIECLPQIARTIEEYATMRALGEWLAQNKPDEAVVAAQGAQTAAIRLRELMSLRKHPTLRRDTPDNNIEL